MNICASDAVALGVRTRVRLEGDEVSMRVRHIIPTTLWLLVGLASSAQAGERDVLVTMSGFLGTTEQGQPILDRLFRRLETQLGWPAQSIKGAYHPDAAAGLAYLKQRRPGYAVVTYEMYAKHRRSLKMQVIGGMELADGAMSKFHVVVKKGSGITKLGQLAGKSIASPHLHEIAFAERVLFGGALALRGAKGARPVQVSAPLAALRKVQRGQADAALVDEPVVAQLSKLPFGSQLEAIHSSARLPPLPVVALRGSRAADRQPMARALQGLCQGEEGAALCRSMRLARVTAATDSTYSDLLRSMSR
jgi:ABC-type phosphate/phosphonate transport system substrate-binding protein